MKACKHRTCPVRDNTFKKRPHFVGHGPLVTGTVITIYCHLHLTFLTFYFPLTCSRCVTVVLNVISTLQGVFPLLRCRLSYTHYNWMVWANVCNCWQAGQTSSSGIRERHRQVYLCFLWWATALLQFCGFIRITNQCQPLSGVLRVQQHQHFVAL